MASYGLVDIVVASYGLVDIVLAAFPRSGIAWWHPMD